MGGEAACRPIQKTFSISIHAPRMGSDFDFAPNNIGPYLPFYLVYTISDRKANGIRSEKSALPAAFFDRTWQPGPAVRRHSG